MPYSNERASRLGHVPTVSNHAVQEAFARWEVAQAKPEDSDRVTSLCVPLRALQSVTPATDVKFAITVDGSDSEVEVTRQHPTIKVGYLRIAGSFLDLDKITAAGEGPFVNPVQIRASHSEAAFDAALPGSGLIRPGYNGRDTWRQEIDHFLRNTRFDQDSDSTLADALLAMHGGPGNPAKDVPIRTCPSCAFGFAPGSEPRVTISGGTCTECGAILYLADVLRTHDEYSQEGSNQTAMTRVMLVVERLMTLSYLEHFYTQLDTPEDVLRRTLFITDGPLALFGVVAPLKRRLQTYNDAIYEWGATKGISAPLLVGIEKSGRFVEHAELIAELIPKGSVMRLTTEYINRMTGRPDGHQYGRDEFYGRRFIFRTTAGDPLVITVPPRAGVLPYEGLGAEEFDSYPTLRVVCEVLDGVRTRLYPNAVIPVALAHNAASLPLGVGHSVLRAMAQNGIQLPKDSQIRYRSPFK
ncbi:hypothetical protein [Arthrobacter sp. FW306-04-A]|uniref:hypothetical protein n=1 Tax=Arthrobacter sp. FW306-04-A TaxID=2879619 RepID=UPI0037BF00CC|nr:hypothetical protein LFT43_04845 [Arthrobacter sp. FW306-04-A]